PRRDHAFIREADVDVLRRGDAQDRGQINRHDLAIERLDVRCFGRQRRCGTWLGGWRDAGSHEDRAVRRAACAPEYDHQQTRKPGVAAYSHPSIPARFGFVSYCLKVVRAYMPGARRPSRLSRSISIRIVRVVGRSAPARRDTLALIGPSSSASTTTSTGVPGRIRGASYSGTSTTSRTRSTAATDNRGVVAPIDAERTNAPTCTNRSVTTPSNGAVIDS